VAERLKRGEPVENVAPQDAFSVMELASEEIIAEVNRSLEYFHEEINEIVLSGGCALIKDFPRLLAEKIGVETKILQPFKNIKIPKKFDLAYIEEMSPIAAVAAGLALRRPGDK
jgi:type IV pilus assembly protein PilM